MNIVLWVLVIGLVLLMMFALANWTLLTAPASLNFLVFTVEGPLGIILLAATLVFVALCVVYVLSLRTATLIEMRRHVKELDAQRALADSAEGSRYTELRAHIDAEGERQRALIEAMRGALVTRIETLERTVLDGLGETSNSLAAHVGQVDDKLDRLAPGGRDR